MARRSERSARSACRGRTSRSSTRRRTCGRRACSARCRSGSSSTSTYVGRRGLYLQRERNINQLADRHAAGEPGRRTSRRCVRYKGYGAIRLSENAGYSKYNSLQISADRRYTNGFKFGVAYTLGKSEDNASDKRDVLWNTYDDTNFWGPSSFDRRHVLVVYYIYDLPFWREPNNADDQHRSVAGRSRVRSSSAPARRSRSRAPTTSRAWATAASRQPVDIVGDSNSNANGQFSTGTGDDNFFFNPQAFANPAAGTFGNSTRNILRNPGDQQWDLALFKNFTMYGSQKLQFRAEIFNFPNHPNLSPGNGGNGVESDITSPNFGRVVTKDNNRRDIQIAVRYLF